MLAAEPAGEILGELPGGAARARAARRRPLQRVALERLLRRGQAEKLGVAVDHREIIVLAAMVEAEPQAEAIRQRHFLFDRFARIDRARALVVDHLARDQMAAVGGGVEDDIVGPPLDAPFERRLQRLVGRVAAVEGEIVAKNDEAQRRFAHQRHQRRQALDVFAVNFDELERSGEIGAAIDFGVRRLDQRRLAHAARAPQQRIIGRQAARKTQRIVDQEIANPVDAAQQRNVDPIDLGDRVERRAVGAPDEGVGAAEIRFRASRRGQPLQRLGDPGKFAGKIGRKGQGGGHQWVHRRGRRAVWHNRAPSSSGGAVERLTQVHLSENGAFECYM